MNKYFLISIVHIFLILSNQSFASQFDIDGVSDSIVGKLWRKVDVPGETIKKLFELVDESEKTKEMLSIDIDITDLNEFINYWKELIIYKSEQEEHSISQNEYKNIDDFIGKVHNLEDQFSPQAIGGSLYIIVDKY
ncbi:MAG: hypothetical protein ACXVDT_15605 [Bacteroidia bacterium]